jgi:glutamate racemase
MIGSSPAGFVTTGNPGRVSDRAMQFLRRQITFTSA